MKFFGTRKNAENTRKTQKITRKTTDSENFFADALHCGHRPRGCGTLRTPISKRGRVVLRTRIICPPLITTTSWFQCLFLDNLQSSISSPLLSIHTSSFVENPSLQNIHVVFTPFGTISNSYAFRAFASSKTKL